MVARYWHRAARSAWRAVVERALAPVAVGLTFASGLALMRGTEHGWVPLGRDNCQLRLVQPDGNQPDPVACLGAGALLLVGA